MVGQGVPCDRKGCRTTATTTRRAPAEPGERFPPMLDLCLEHAREFDTLNLPPPPAPKPRRAPPPPPKLVTTPAPDRRVTKARKFSPAELDTVLALVSENPGSTSSTLQALSEIPGTAWLLQRALEMDPPRVRAEGSSGKGSRRWFSIPPVLEPVEQLQSPYEHLEAPVEQPSGILALANTLEMKETALRVGLGLRGEASGATAAAIAELRASRPAAPDDELGDDATEETTAPPDEAPAPGVAPPPGDLAWTQPDTVASIDAKIDAARSSAHAAGVDCRPLLDAPPASQQDEIPAEAWIEVDGVRWATDGVLMVRESFAAHAPKIAHPWRVPPFLPDAQRVRRMLFHTDDPHPGVFSHAFAPLLACARAVVTIDDEDIHPRVRAACLLVDGDVVAVLMPLRAGPGVYADGGLSPIYYSAADAIKADQVAALKEAAAGEEAARKKMQENGFRTNPGGTRIPLDQLLELYVDHVAWERHVGAMRQLREAWGIDGPEYDALMWPDLLAIARKEAHQLRKFGPNMPPPPKRISLNNNQDTMEHEDEGPDMHQEPPTPLPSYTAADLALQRICMALFHVTDHPVNDIMIRVEELVTIENSLPRTPDGSPLNEYFKWGSAIIPSKVRIKRGEQALGAALAHIANGRTGLATTLLSREASNGEALIGLVDALEVRAHKVWKITRAMCHALNGSYCHLADLGGAF